MSLDPHPSPRAVEVPTLYRAASYVALGWAVVLMVRALYNCFAVVGPGQFLLGIVYYGSHGGSGQAETSSFDYAVLYALGAVFILRGSHWARGLVCGVAAVEGYNRLRSLTGALFDSAQRPWFTGQLQGELLLATLVAGVLVTVALVLMLSRRVGAHTPWQPPPSPWTAAAQEATLRQQQFAQQQTGYAGQPQPQQAYYPQPAATPTYAAPPAPQQVAYQLPQQGYPAQQSPSANNPYATQQSAAPQPAAQPPQLQPSVPAAAQPQPQPDNATQVLAPQDAAPPADAAPLPEGATRQLRAIPPTSTS